MRDFQIAVLASGSKGNATLIRSGDQCFLIDAGLSCRALTGKLRQLGCDPEDLTAVFITHEHIDHIKGLQNFMKNFRVPVYGSQETWRAFLVKNTLDDRSMCRVMTGNVKCGDIIIKGFSIPHDAVDPLGYVFADTYSRRKCCYLTDAGFITDTIRKAMDGVTSLVLEANHDIDMLKRGSYPPVLKQRILSARGHLSNDSAGWFLAELERLPESIVLAHLSQENNTAVLARDTVCSIVESKRSLRDVRIAVASQDETVADYEL